MESIMLQNIISGLLCNQGPWVKPRSDSFSELCGIALYNQVGEIMRE